jgi:hypothetical protein
LNPQTASPWLSFDEHKGNASAGTAALHAGENNILTKSFCFPEYFHKAGISFQ